MKRTIIALLSLAGVATAETLIFQLPDSTPAITLPGDGYVDRLGDETWVSMLDKMRGKSYGVYAGPQYSNITTMGNNPWGTNGEGTWVLSDDGTGSITLLGRNGVHGDACVLVLGSDVENGAQFSSLSFNAAISSPSSLTGSIILGLAIVDNTGEILASAGGSMLSVNSSGNVSQELVFAGGITWNEGYKAIAIIDGPSATPPTTAYTISGISVTGQLIPSIPEPATATLSLLALAGLAARRRR